MNDDKIAELAKKYGIETTNKKEGKEMIKCIEEVKLWNNGYVRLFDFSEANSSQEAREEACAVVSSACYGKEISNKPKHYKRLISEHAGSATEILQFLPVVIENATYRSFSDHIFNGLLRYGYMQNESVYTNMRAILNYDCNKFICKDLAKAEGFAVFNIKIPYMIVDHSRRHKLISSFFAENWQSNRSFHEKEYFESEDIRQELTNKGEFGLMYVNGWLGGWLRDPATFDNFFKVRRSNSAQKETQELANAMYSLIQKHY